MSAGIAQFKRIFFFLSSILDYEDTGVLENIEAEVEAEVEAAVTDETPADALKNGDDYSSGPNPKILTRN